MHPLIRSVEAILPRASRQFGMKARNLAALARAGFPVPAAYVLASEGTDLFLRSALPADLQLARLVESESISSTALDDIRARLLAAEVPANVRDALHAAFAELKRAGAETVVLRPSRIVSEEVEGAVSGLHESALGLRSADALVHAAQRSWASLYTPAAMGCARSLGTDLLGSLALVVQAMVPAEASGTLWTANPLTNDASEMTLEAVFGLGLGLRDPAAAPDLYQIDRRTHWIRDRVVGRKERAYRLDAEGAVTAAVVESAAQYNETLDEQTLRQMVELGRRIEAHFGDPREIEWAVVADAVYVLQARPIAARPGMIARRETARGRDERDLANAQWLNLGAIESLSDVVTPLTWSGVNAFCRDGLPKALAAIGVDAGRGLQGVRSQRGRAYLGVSDLSLLGRGYSLLLDGASQLSEADGDHRLSAAELVGLPLQILGVARQRREHARGLIEQERNFHAERARLLSIDPRILSGVALADTLFDAQRLADRLMRSLVVCTADLLRTWGMLRRVLATSGDPRARSIELGLLCGIEELHRSDMVADLEPLIAVCRDPDVRASLPAGRWSDLEFEQVSRHAVSAPLASFVSDHGHRARQELELASPRWAERPGVALVMACSPIALDSPNSVARRREGARQAFMRAQAELADRMGEALSRATMVLVHTVRRDVVQRETVRGWVLHALHLMRRCVVDASRRLCAREPVARDDAAFLMSLDELRSYMRGEIRVVAQRVTQRRALQREIEALPSPPDAFVGYPQVAPPTVQWARLHGAAVSPGSVRGVARVIRSLDDLQRAVPGDIFVLRDLDPAWGPLMCRAAGVIAELGGPLSPGAVLLRQYAVPTVSMLGASLRSVREGEVLHVDAYAAVVERVADRA
jgi:pyruvate,water dikinase